LRYTGFVRKKIVPRILILVPVYVIVFLALALIQFPIQGGFSERIGGLEIMGQYYQQDKNNGGLDGTEPAGAKYEEAPLEGDVTAFFKGLVFSLTSGSEQGLCLVDSAGRRVALIPKTLAFVDNAARFKLAGSGNPADHDADAELIFYVRGNAGREELIISGIFGENSAALEIPFTTQSQTKITGETNSSAQVLVNGVAYSFDSPLVDIQKRRIVLSNRYSVLSYRIVPEKPVFNPIEYTLSGGMELSQYDEIVRQWTNRAFSVWGQEIQTNMNNERLVATYIGEAARHDAYSAAVSAVPSAFRGSTVRTYVSSPFLGRMDMALRSLSDHERLRREELSRLLDSAAESVEKIADAAAGAGIAPSIDALLGERHLIEYLAIRGYNDLIDQSAAILSALDLETLPFELWPAIFELWRDWFIWKPDTENPFMALSTQLCALLPRYLRKDAENRHVFVFGGETGENGESAVADMKLNISLGAALATYGEFSASREWAAIGRSIVISVLSLTDNTASVPASLTLSAVGALGQAQRPANTAAPIILSAMELYTALAPSQFYPHAAAALGLAGRNIWLWTVSPAVSASFSNNILDINVNFLLGETHYLLIRGIGSFAKIQLRNVDYRSDPQFESYNAPGWAYSAAEETLLVKLIHRTENERIRIFY
jgi:hypothetical protein